MYVIYINDRPLTLRSLTSPRTSGPALLNPDLETHLNPDPETHLTANYSGKPRTLLNYADMLEKGSPKVMSVDILADDLEKLWTDFRSKYKWVPAAGGVVTHRATGYQLFIYRRDFWDLPKGKIDEGEDAPTAALREVMEETGVRDLVLGEAMTTTYHTYRNRKGKRVLKPTYWFEMSSEQDELIPEAEEGIEEVCWRAAADVLTNEKSFYVSLRPLLIRN